MRSKMNLEVGTVAQIAALWKAGSGCERGHARNALFWACADAVEKRGFVGDARRFLERVARWAL